MKSYIRDADDILVADWAVGRWHWLWKRLSHEHNRIPKPTREFGINEKEKKYNYSGTTNNENNENTEEIKARIKWGVSFVLIILNASKNLNPKLFFFSATIWDGGLNVEKTPHFFRSIWDVGDK